MEEICIKYIYLLLKQQLHNTNNSYNNKTINTTKTNNNNKTITTNHQPSIILDKVKLTKLSHI